MAGNIKGLTVEIGGDTTKLGKSLDDIKKRSKTLSTELGSINKLLKLDPGNTDLLKQKMTVLSEAISSAKDRLVLLKEEEKRVQAQFAKGEASAEQVRAVEREVINATNKLKQYENALEETGVQANQAAAGVKNLGDEAGKTDAKTGKFGDNMKKLANVGLAAVAAAAAAAVAGIKALIDMTVGGAAFADTVLTEAAVTGIATDKLQEYMYAAQLVDVSTETLTGSLVKNVRSMSSAKDGTGATAEAYAKLGIRVTDSTGALRSSEAVFWEVIDALGRMENDTERDATAMDLLGKSAQDLNPLIKAGADAMQELADKAHEAGYVMSEETLSAYGAFDDNLQYLKANADGAKNALGTVLLPTLTEMADKGAELMGNFSKGIADANGDVAQMSSVVDTTLTDGMNALVPYVDQAVGLAGQVVQSLAGALINNLPQIATTATSIVSSLVGGLTTTMLPSLMQALPGLVGSLMSLFSSMVSQVGTTLPGLLSTLVGQIIPQLVSTIISHTPDLVSAGITLLFGLIEAIPTIVMALVESTPQIVAALIQGLASIPGMLWDLLSQAILKFVEFGVAAFNRVSTDMAAIGPAIKNFLSDVPGNIWSAIVSGVDKVKQWGIDMLNKAKTGMQELKDGILEKLEGLPGDVASVGTNLVEGLWNGINGSIDWLIGQISGFATNVLDSIKSFFGIASPSKETAWMGTMLDQGLAKGILGNMRVPVDAMKKLTDSVMDSAAMDVNGLNIERQLQYSYNVNTSGMMENTGLFARLDRILNAVEQGQVVLLDGDALVGATVERMDAQLGRRRQLAVRGAL